MSQAGLKKGDLIQFEFIEETGELVVAEGRVRTLLAVQFTVECDAYPGVVWYHFYKNEGESWLKIT